MDISYGSKDMEKYHIPSLKKNIDMYVTVAVLPI